MSDGETVNEAVNEAADEPGNEVVTSDQAEQDSLRFVSSEVPCPYLDDRLSRNEAYSVEVLDGETYENLMSVGFRRSGRIVYRPRCRGCQACQPIRVPVASFKPSRSMRRVWANNTDVRAEISEPCPTAEKHEIFTRYLDFQHDGEMSRSYDAFERFLYDSPMDTQEIVYRLGDRTVGVSIVDQCPGGLSSVFTYFDPQFAKRSIGTFTVLWEIEHCRRIGARYYYLGYYVAGSKTMAYKSRFQPNELLVGSDHWVAPSG